MLGSVVTSGEGVNLGLWSKQETSSEDLCLDAAAGFFALILSAVLALFFGGMAFFEPWVISATTFLFAAGCFRGTIPGEPWAKAAALNFFPWSLTLIVVSVNWLDGHEILSGIPVTFLAMAMTFAAALTGVLARRHTSRRK